MSIRVETLNHLRRLTTVQEKTLRACLTYGKAAANKMVRTAKLTRPWTDRTHMAKNALNGGASEIAPGRVRVELAHGTRYGAYLENVKFRHKGRLAILYPTVKKMAPEIIQGWARVISKGG